jgi:hypothetical protein
LDAIIDLEGHRISWPTIEEAPSIMQGFQFGPLGPEFGFRNRLPRVIGAMDGTHIPIYPPKREGVRYINRKGWHSINVLAVVDWKERFRYIRVGEPGIIIFDSFFDQ